MSEWERELLARAREGDLDAFADLVRHYERRVRSVLARLLDDDRDVDEAAQDTFVKAWRNLERFRGEAAPFTWLYRIAVNEALQRVRKKQLDTRPLEDTDLGAGQGPALRHEPPIDVLAADRESLAFLTERLRSLPFEVRAPLVLRDIEGWTYDDVARALDISVPAAKSRVHRARLQLGQEFEAWRTGRGDL